MSRPARPGGRGDVRPPGAAPTGADAGRERRATVLRINEIFHSIQGESRHAGRPCVLIRLTGCNLRCVWCDTDYAFEEGSDLTVGAVLDRIAAFGTRFALVTGGEPLLQPGVHDLMAALLDAGYEVSLETGGSLDVRPVDPRVHVVLDLKAPGSGMTDRNRWENLAALKPDDEIKFVIADRADYVWSRDVVRRHRLAERFGVLFSPVHGVLHPRTLSEWMLAEALPVRLQLQIHKYIWPADMRGV